MKSMLKRFVSDERGMETVEYVVLVSLIVAGLVVAVPVLLDAINAAFNKVSDTVASGQ
jgi:Flp pilus assembly pilin Flp